MPMPMPSPRRAQSLPTRRSARIAARSTSAPDARIASAPDVRIASAPDVRTASPPDACWIAGRIARAPPPPPPPPPRPPPPSPPRCALAGLIALIVVLIIILLSLFHPPPLSTTAVAPPCHVRGNSSFVLPPCALFPDLNRVLAHVSTLRHAAHGGSSRHLSPQFFQPAHLHLQHHQSNDAWLAYVTSQGAEQAVMDMESDADLAHHVRHGVECARQDLRRRSWHTRFLPLLSRSPTSCTPQEHQLHFASVTSILRRRLRAVAESLDHDRTRDRQLEHNARAARASIYTQVQHVVDLTEERGIHPDTSRLASLRHEYAAWLVEGMRWSCRAREYDYAHAVLQPAGNNHPRRPSRTLPSGPLLSGTDIGAAEIADEASLRLALGNFADLILHVATGALDREHQCILQHAQDAFSHCLPMGYDVSVRDADGTLHSISPHHHLDSDDPLPILCEHILDPYGIGCSAHPHRIWWAWHNLANLSSSLLLSSSSPTPPPPPPPHLRHCRPQNPSTPLHHWSRYLRPLSTPQERRQHSTDKARVASRFGFAVPLNAQAAQGKVRHLEPWMGILRVDGGLWKE